MHNDASRIDTSGASPDRDGPTLPSSSQPPYFLAAQATASQSRTSSSSTLVPMQHIYPSLPDAGASTGYRFPRTSSEPFLDDSSRLASAGPLAAANGRGAALDDRSLDQPLSPTTIPVHCPERRLSLQDRRNQLVQTDGGLPLAGLTCLVNGGINGEAAVAKLDMRSLTLSTAAISPLAVETPSASKRSFIATGGSGVVTERDTPPARQGPGVADRTPRLSTIVPAGSDLATPLSSDSSSGQPSRECSGGIPAPDLSSLLRRDSWDSAGVEGFSPWSRFQAQFQSARQPSTFSQSASAGSTYATTPDSEDPHHYSHVRPASILPHQQLASASSGSQASHLGQRTASQMSLPLSSSFATDGLPGFSPSPYFKEIVSAHSIGDRSASAGPMAPSQSPPHRLDTADLIAHYSSMSNQSPKTTQTDGFFDYGSRVSNKRGGIEQQVSTSKTRSQQPQAPSSSAQPSTYSYRSPAGAPGATGPKQRASNADATLGSSAFAPGLRARVVETLERVSARLDWKSGGGEGVVSIVEYSATQGASKELVCPIIARINARHAGSEAIFSVYHQSPQEDLRQHTASLYAEGSYLSPAFLDSQHETLRNRVFSYSVAKAFGAVMAPPKTVHVGFSVLDLQWLHSPRPPGMSMSAAADAELRSFLDARSREFRTEGVLVLAFTMSNSRQPYRKSSESSSVASPSSSTFRNAKRTDDNGSTPYPSNESYSKQRAGSVSESATAAGSDVWRQISSVLSVCVTRLVSIGSIRSAIAPLLTTSLPLWPRSSAELRRTLADAKVAADWEVIQSHGLTDEDDASVPDDLGPFSMVHPAYRALQAGTLSTNSYAEHVVSFVKIVYEAHLRAVMIDRAGMSRGATEMTLQALFSILTEKCEEGCLDGLALDFGIIALRRL